jgi:ATP-binding cassette, subfamily B, bacterial
MSLALATSTEGRVGQPLRPGTLRRVARYLRPQAVGIIGLLLVVLLHTLVVVVPPLLFQQIIDDGVLKRQPTVLLGLSIAATGATVVGALLQFGSQYLSSRLGQEVVFRLRNDIFSHLQRMPISVFSHTPTGVLVSRMNNDTLGAQGTVSGILPQAAAGLGGLVMVAGTMTYLSWQITLVTLVVPPLVLLPARGVGRRLHAMSHARLEAVAGLSSFLTERLNVAGALLTRLYGRRQAEHAEFITHTARTRDIAVRMTVIGGVFSTALNGVIALSVTLVYLIGGYLVLAGSLSVGTLVALAALLPRLYAPVNTLSTSHVEFMTALASFERIFDVLDVAPTVTDKPAARRLTPDALDVRFDDVTFSYPDRPGHDRATTGAPVLRRVSFCIGPRQRVALVGLSGSGKSTIAALLARLYDVDSGAIRIGSQDIRDVSLESLRSAIGMLTQEAHLFHDSIRTNLRYARPDATEEEIVDACRAARIWSLVESLPNGLDTVVGDRGYRLSGGEKQRLAIARLLLKRPRIVILDEATAHLDVESEFAVQQALNDSLAGQTTLVIAHRLSTIRNADQILVLSHGRIVEHGTHADLLRRNGLYAQLCRTDLTNRGDDPAARVRMPVAPTRTASPAP